MKLYNKILLICGLALVMTSCYEKPPAPVDGLIKTSLGSIPSASDYTWVGSDPDAGGSVTFTFNFWSDTDIEAINMYMSTDGGTTETLVQTNSYAQSGFSQFYSTDTIAYSLTIPAALVAGEDVDYRGEVVNTNGNTADRGINFTVQ